MMKPENKRPVSLEDLLRLKRAERPAAEFWTRFEQELRAKQLAAIVGKRPWWERMPKWIAALRRYPLPLGAAAIFTVTFVSVHHFHAPAPQVNPSNAASAEDTIAAIDPAQSAPVVGAVAANEAADSAVATATEPPVNVAATSASSDARASGRIAEMLWFSGVSQNDSNDSAMPAVQSLVAANLEAVKATHPELVRKFLGRTASYETEVERKPAVDPFTRLRGPSEIKRDRLLAKALPVSLASNTWNGGERIARRLSEERVTEDPTISRIGAAGDRLSLKF